MKDLFTLVNLLSGVVAIHYLIAGQLSRAGYAVIVGYLGGDLLDGTVARRTGTGNRFGAEFDQQGHNCVLMRLIAWCVEVFSQMVFHVGAGRAV